jgi:hypothetical protein
MLKRLIGGHDTERKNNWGEYVLLYHQIWMARMPMNLMEDGLRLITASAGERKYLCGLIRYHQPDCSESCDLNIKLLTGTSTKVLLAWTATGEAGLIPGMTGLIRPIDPLNTAGPNPGTSSTSPM